MKRREVLTLLGGAAATWPVGARGQQPQHSVGLLSSGSPAAHAGELTGFRQGLSETGWADRTNGSRHLAWAESNFERLPTLGADLIGRHVSLIFANSVGVRYGKNAAATAPIVFTSANDPVEDGLVAS